MSLLDKAQRFRALHDAPEAFVIANAWDAGSAKILATVGFQALATSSGAHAGVLGRMDGQVNREEALAHAQAIVEAADLRCPPTWRRALATRRRRRPKQSDARPASGLSEPRLRTRPAIGRARFTIPRTRPNGS